MELWQLSALELGRRIARREIRAVEVVTHLLQRIEALNPTLNAIVTLDAEGALAAAHAVDARLDQGEQLGPLAGVPITIKDLTETKGLRTTYGSVLLREHIPTVDAVLVERLRRAGLLILGKTNTPEFGGKFDTENRLFGATRNPWKLSNSPGVSSGGAAAQVAAGMGPLAHGNDGGGSIRVPASCCGVFGLKPQFGRVPFWPRQDSWATLNHEGPITRTVRDAAALLDIMAGPDFRDPYSLPGPTPSFLKACEGEIRGLRIAWSPTPGYGRVDPEVQMLCEAAARRFEALGCYVEEASANLDFPAEAFLGIIVPRMTAQLERDLPEGFTAQIDPMLAVFLPYTDQLSARDVARAEFARLRLYDQVERFLQHYDLWLLPVMAAPPHRSGEFGPTEIAGQPVETPLEPFFTFPFNLTGHPAASVPAGFTHEGLPVGLQIVGRRFDEATVLRAAARYEEAYPWAHQWPEIALNPNP